MQARYGTYMLTSKTYILSFIISILTVSLGHNAAYAEQPQQMPAPSDAIANQLTNLLRSITGAPAKKKAVEFQRTRLVIELERSAKFEVFSLVNPNRVVLQLPSMRTRVPVVEKSSKSLITSIRGGQSGLNQTRIIINVASPVIVEKAGVIPASKGRGAQLSLDIVPTKIRKSFAMSPGGLKGSFQLGGAALQPPVPRQAAHPSVDSPRSHKHVIVIDPGHGGHDSGARKHGVQEKDVVLAFSRKLRDKLEGTGRYKVLMTRSEDVFVTLKERRAFAERHKAALFISIHADYAKSKASGATIYSLRKSVAKALKKSTKKKLARRNLLTRDELKTLKAAKISSNPNTLHKILEDLAFRDVEATQFQTNEFTDIVIRHMGKTTDMRSRPHQTAAFRVLKTATMPAVLIELAYVSNRRDARRLKSEAWRKKVSSSIARAVDRYFADVKRLPM